jgi:hypothetical protein
VSFSRWNESRVLAEATEFEGITDRPTLAAIALLHTEAGIANGKFGGIAASVSGHIVLGGWGLEDVFEPHSLTANRIVDRLLDGLKGERDEFLRRFGLDWYIVAMSTCQYKRRFACTVELLEKGESYFEGEARYRLVEGSVSAPPFRSPSAIRQQESYVSGQRSFGPLVTAVQNPYAYSLATSSRREQTRTPGSTNISGGVPDLAFARRPLDVMTEVLDSANRSTPAINRPTLGLTSVAYLEKALQLDPSLAEARIRLGHIWYLRKDPRAPGMFERALEEARSQRKPFLVYLAAIYLGQWEEEGGNLAAAIPHYRTAFETVNSHMAALNLSQALIRLGQGDEGWAIGRRMFGRPGATSAPDPLDMYPHAQYWQVDELLEGMRELVRTR